MHTHSAHGWALIVSPLAAMAMMALHPEGHDVFSSLANVTRMAGPTAWVHAIAIASLVGMLFGYIGLARRLGIERPDVTGATVAFMLATGAATLAGTMNGFVAPRLGMVMLGAADPDQRAAARGLLLYNGLLSQAVIKVYVASVAGAMALWSLAIVRTRILPRALGWSGAAIALALVAPLAGVLRLDVQGFGAVVALQAAWAIAAGLLLLGRRPEPRR